MNYSEILAFARTLRKQQTPAESFFWEKVRNRRFHGSKFTRQFIIEHSDYKFFIADFHCHELKLIVEVDGQIHKYQKEYDLIREDILRDRGFHILRFDNQEVLNNWMDVERRLMDFIELRRKSENS